MDEKRIEDYYEDLEIVEQPIEYESFDDGTYQVGGPMWKLKKKTVEQEAEIRRLRAALAFYGDGKHWNQNIADAVMDDHKYYYYLLAEKQVAIEDGEIARTVLGLDGQSWVERKENIENDN